MKAMLLTKLKGMATALVVGCAVMATTAAGWQSNAVIAAEGQAREEPTRRTAPRDPDKERIAQLERERDELLKMVRDLKGRLEKLEAGEKATDSLLKLTKQRDELSKLVQMEAERAREAARLSKQKEVITPELAEKLARLKLLEEEARGLKGREKIPEGLAEKLKNLELEAAKAAKMKVQIERERAEKLKQLENVKQPEKVKKPENVEQPGKVKKPENVKQPEKVKQPENVKQPEKVKKPENVKQPEKFKKPEIVKQPEKVKQPEGDRVAALEGRVRKMEQIIERLQAELDRLKK